MSVSSSSVSPSTSSYSSSSDESPPPSPIPTAPVPPPQDSLWDVREEQFEHIQSNQLVLPVPEEVHRTPRIKGYCLHLLSISNWQIPPSVVPYLDTPDSESDEEDSLVWTLGVQISLFHTISRRFYGSTWTSPDVPCDPSQIVKKRDRRRHKSTRVLPEVQLGLRAFFLSDVADDNCVAVVELVIHGKEMSTKAIVVSGGSGWMILPLSTPSSDQFTSGDSVGIFEGSPRVLWEVPTSSWKDQPLQEGCRGYFQLQLLPQLKQLKYYVRLNEILQALDVIPGLKHSNIANVSDANNPRIQLLKEQKDINAYVRILRDIVSVSSQPLPKQIQLEESLTLSVLLSRVIIHLREKTEHSLLSRLKVGRWDKFKKAAAIDGEITSRHLSLAYHNGRTFISKPHQVYLKPDEDGSDVLLPVEKKVEMKGLVRHPCMALIVLLQFSTHFRIAWPKSVKSKAMRKHQPAPTEEEMILVTMGTRAIVPSDGEKIYLFDGHDPYMLQNDNNTVPHVLHVDLKSGADCRPYTNSALYFLPNKADDEAPAPHYQSRNATSSVGYIDLVLDVKGKPLQESKVEVPPIKVPEPLKDESYAAEEWAKKVLTKANDNPVLAVALNSLAAPQEVAPEAAPAKPKPPVPSVKPKTVVPSLPVSELTRASKTLLSRHGFLDDQDRGSNPEKKHDQPMRTSLKSIETELKDVYQAHEIRFHFAAYRLTSIAHHRITPSRLYLTFHFYTFKVTKTEALRLSKPIPSTSKDSDKIYLLMREGSHGSKPSLAVQFDVDTTATDDILEAERFATYLRQKTMHIDVWDADTLFQVGTCALPLHELMRQGSGVKKMEVELDIVESVDSDHTGTSRDQTTITSLDTDGRLRIGGERHLPQSVGKLQILLSNYGHKGEHLPSRVQSTYSTSVPTAVESGKKRVRARPMIESHPDLRKLLTEEGFYGQRSNGRRDVERKWNKSMDAKEVPAERSLSLHEVDILCELFRSEDDKVHSGKKVKIVCDMDSQNGLPKLLSMKVPQVTKPNSIKPAESKEEIKPKQPSLTVEEKANRLKLVIETLGNMQVTLRDAFKSFDMNEDGMLSAEDFVRALRSLGDVVKYVTDRELLEIASAADCNHNEVISLTEFLSYISKDTVEVRERWEDHVKRVLLRAAERDIRVEEVFSVLDISHDGKLSRDEFIQALQRLGAHVDESLGHEVDAWWKALDRNQDGRVAYLEFLQPFVPNLNVGDKKEEMKEQVRTVLQQLAANGYDFASLFNHFDQDRNGHLSMTEAMEAMDKMLREENKQEKLLKDDSSRREAIMSILRELDKDKNDTIEYAEFLSLCGVAEPDIPNIVQYEHSTRHSKVEKKLIKLLLRAHQAGVPIPAVMGYFDVNDDGNITVDEFQSGMQKLFKGTVLEVEDVKVMAARLGAHSEDGHVPVNIFRDFVEDVHSKQHALQMHFDALIEKLVEWTKNQGTVELLEWRHLMLEEGNVAQEKLTEIESLLIFFDIQSSSDDGNVDLNALSKTLNKQTASDTKTIKDSVPAEKEPKEISQEEKASLLTKKLESLFTKASASSISMEECFQHFDKNGDGVVTIDEFLIAVQELGLSDDIESIRECLHAVDTDNNGTICLDELKTLYPVSGETRNKASELTAYLRTHEASKENILKCIDDFMQREEDISPHELHSALTQFIQNPSDDLKTILQDFVVGSGKIDLEHVKKAILNIRDESMKEAPAAVVAHSVDSVTTKQDADVNESNDANEGKEEVTPKSSANKIKGGEPKEENKNKEKPTKTEEEKGSEKENTTSIVEEKHVVKMVKPSLRRANSFASFRKAQKAKADSRGVETDTMVVAKQSQLRQQKRPTSALATHGNKKTNVKVSVDEQKDQNASLSKSASEVLEQLRSIWTSEGGSSTSMNQWFRQSDKGNTGMLSYEQFASALRDLSNEFRSISSITGSEVARRLDASGKGGVSAEDCRSYFSLPLLSPISATRISDQPDTIPRHYQKHQLPTKQSMGAAQKDEKETSMRNIYDCGYSYHPNPEVRAVELKVRKAAVEAYKKGIVPLRVLDQFINRPIGPSGAQHLYIGCEPDLCQSKRKELLRVELIQLLMELGLYLKSDGNKDGDADDGNLEYGATTKIHDRVYARQLERLARFQQKTKDENRAQRQLVRAVRKTYDDKRGKTHKQYQRADLKQFQDDKEHLHRLLSYYRDGQKKSLVYALVRDQVTTSFALYPSFAAVEFCELPFTNPYNHPDRFRIEVLPSPNSPSELANAIDFAILRDGDEWAYYRENLPLSFGSEVDGKKEVERDMVDVHSEFLAESRDFISIPMRVRWLSSSDKQSGSSCKVPLSVAIKSCSHHTTVALFQISIIPKDLQCNRVLRFSHPATSVWKWTLRVPSEKYVMCYDSKVILEEVVDEDFDDNQNETGRLVTIKCRVGDYPSLEIFYLVLYDDAYYACIHEIWQVRVQSKLRVDLHTSLGQNVHNELVIQGDKSLLSTKSLSSRHVQCFTTARNRTQLQFRPQDAFQLHSQAFNRIAFSYMPLEVSPLVSSASQASFARVQVNLVDVDTDKLIGAWMLQISISPPTVTKTYELHLSRTQRCNKKVSYWNPWPQAQTVLLRSTCAALMQPREALLHLPPQGQGSLRLAFFPPAMRAQTAENQDEERQVYLFIIDQSTDQSEDCLLFRLIYS